MPSLMCGIKVKLVNKTNKNQTHRYGKQTSSYQWEEVRVRDYM